MPERPQQEKFRDLAREVGADENEAEFDAMLRRMRERREKPAVAPTKKPRDE